MKAALHENQTMTNYPLSWPTGWRRMESLGRARARFKNSRRELSVAEGADRVFDALRKMGVSDKTIIVSTNIQPTLSGRPRSQQIEPSDPGVAIYWTKRLHRPGRIEEQHRVMAIDLYRRVADNLAAIAATLEAMRAIERHGGAQILERAFTGFTALPSPNDWRHVMGFERTPTLDEARRQFIKLAASRHPDSGGNHEAMAELNRAWEQAQRELV